MPRMLSLSALNEVFASAIAVGLARRSLRTTRRRPRRAGRRGTTLFTSPICERLGRAVAAAQVPHLARLLLADHAREIGGAEARVDRAHLRARPGRRSPTRPRASGRRSSRARCRRRSHSRAPSRSRAWQVADRGVHLLDRHADRAAPARYTPSWCASGRRRCRTRASPAPVSTITFRPLVVARVAERVDQLVEVCARNALSTSGRLIVIVATRSAHVVEDVLVFLAIDSSPLAVHREAARDADRLARDEARPRPRAGTRRARGSRPAAPSRPHRDRRASARRSLPLAVEAREQRRVGGARRDRR